MSESKAEKIDLYKLHKAEYATPKKPMIVETNPALYMAVDGSGQPGGDVFQDRVGALYGMAYTVKFQSKFAGRDFVVCKLEGLWGVGEQAGNCFAEIPPEEVKWKLMIRMPEFVGEDQLAEARASLHEKGKVGDFESVRLETIDEGPCVQMLHLGPYEQEGETVERMMTFAAEQGYEPHMWHHDIYLSDPRRIPPERLKTIVRHPVKKA